MHIAPDTGLAPTACLYTLACHTPTDLTGPGSVHSAPPPNLPPRRPTASWPQLSKAGSTPGQRYCSDRGTSRPGPEPTTPTPTTTTSSRRTDTMPKMNKQLAGQATEAADSGRFRSSPRPTGATLAPWLRGLAPRGRQGAVTGNRQYRGQRAGRILRPKAADNTSRARRRQGVWPGFPPLACRPTPTPTS